MLKGQARFAQGPLKKDEMIRPEMRLAKKGLMNPLFNGCIKQTWREHFQSLVMRVLLESNGLWRTSPRVKSSKVGGAWCLTFKRFRYKPFSASPPSLFRRFVCNVQVKPQLFFKVISSSFTRLWMSSSTFFSPPIRFKSSESLIILYNRMANSSRENGFLINSRAPTDNAVPTE